ncbi:hypothetical protein IHE45_14G133700 [Dioscorea alata]|uniref:Uncharacterized protein n=1 Tax=Dioscorea alata TaxID=55571 RepID=A0ACB7UVK7_DIOAL|nr:hypothetical protein IHE45_14G133700 [Dioscorea alata]
MEEEVMASIENLRNPSIGPIDYFSLPTWKLYDNPHYSSTCLPPHFSVAAAKLTSIFRPMNDDNDELELALARIEELKVELELERRMRKRVESLNRALARDLAEQRKARQLAESLRVELEDKVKKAMEEMEEERRMLMVAEVWREERVQMKLAEAKFIMEEKLNVIASPEKPAGMVASDSSNENKTNSDGAPVRQQRKEVENPHIKRGIKGCVEFPKVLKKDGMKVAPLGFSLECQKAQLMILMKHNNHHKTSSSSCATAFTDNLVM